MMKIVKRFQTFSLCHFLRRFVECFVGSFKDVDCEFIDVIVFNCAGRVADSMTVGLIDFAADNLMASQ